MRFETAPGLQMQADFTTIRRGCDRLLAFVATLGYSRAAFVRFTDAEQFAIGFHSRVSDAALLDLLDTHNAKPTRAYIFASGFSGSHSSRNAAAGHVANEVFIQRVREETIDFFEKSLKGNTHRLQNLVQAHPGEELIQDEKLNSDLRSLLRLRGQFESVLHDAKSGNPIVYAVQIKLPAADLQKMRAHPLVRVTVSNDSVQSRSQIVQSLKPSGLENEYVRDETITLSNEDVVTKAASLIDLTRPNVPAGKPGLEQH